MYWESGMHEDEGGVIPQGIPIPKVATCCTEREVAKWTTRSTGTMRKNILWPPKHIAEFQGQKRWIQNTRHTPLCSRTTGHESQRDTVKKLIGQFESHPNKESSCRTSIRLKELMNSAKSRRSWELCETSSKKQCTDCAFYWEIGIVCCTCGRCSKSSQRTQELDKNNYDVLSIPGFVIKKNTIRGVVDLLNGNECRSRQRKCYKKLVNPSMEDSNPYLRDSTKTRHILCHSSGGPRSKLLNMTRFAQQNLKEFKIRNIG